MIKIRPYILTYLLMAPLTVSSQSGFKVEILETDPSMPAMLNSNEPLYVRLKYQSDQALRFQAKGYLHGSKLERSAAFNPAPEYPAGHGEAIAWISYRDAVTIDELRVTVSDQRWQKLNELSIAGQISWSNTPSSTRRHFPPWVQTLNAQQQNMTRNSMATSNDDSVLWGLLLMLMGWSIPAYIILQIYMFLKYRDGWRKPALIPLIITVPLFIYTLFALLAGSNLWPLLMLFVTPFACIYLLLILLLKKRSNTGE